MATPKPHAVVFGASGIAGWALVKELLNDYPLSNTFGRITAVLNRPMSLEDSQWPRDDRLRIAIGANLTADDAVLQETLKAQIKEVETISHVYYAGGCRQIREDSPKAQLTEIKRTSRVMTSRRSVESTRR